MNEEECDQYFKSQNRKSYIYQSILNLFAFILIELDYCFMESFGSPFGDYLG